MKKKQDKEASILLIYTGGTIGMVENPISGVLEAFDFTYLKENFPELYSLGCSIEIEAFYPPLDSSSITPELWASLSKKIADNYHKFDGFVILHGTDTMAYSASALSFMLQGLSKPVIFTGSQLPIGKLRTDGRENLITAIEIAAACDDMGNPMISEVCIFFDNYLLRGNRTSKISADQFNAFGSFNYPQLAYAGVDIKYNEPIIRHHKRTERFECYPCYDANVAIIKLFPGITREVIEVFLSIPTLKGVILETFGSGNAPMESWLLNTLQKAIARGVVIVNVTQCVNGYVEMSRYATGRLLQEIGLISGYDSTSESAVTKLMYLLGRGYSTEEVKKYMAIPLSGEITTSDEERKLHLAHHLRR